MQKSNSIRIALCAVSLPCLSQFHIGWPSIFKKEYRVSYKFVPTLCGGRGGTVRSFLLF